MTTQVTTGESLNNIGGTWVTTGRYTTTAAGSQIDSYGTVLESVTEGESVKDDGGTELKAYVLQNTVYASLFGVGHLGTAILRYPEFHSSKIALINAFRKSSRNI